MHYEVKQILEKIEGAVILEIEGQKSQYADTSMILGETVADELVVASITAKNNIIILALKKRDVIKNDLNETWVKNYIEKYGEKPSFF